MYRRAHAERRALRGSGEGRGTPAPPAASPAGTRAAPPARAAPARTAPWRALPPPRAQPQQLRGATTTSRRHNNFAAGAAAEEGGMGAVRTLPRCSLVPLHRLRAPARPAALPRARARARAHASRRRVPLRAPPLALQPRGEQILRLGVSPLRSRSQQRPRLAARLALRLPAAPPSARAAAAARGGGTRRRGGAGAGWQQACCTMRARLNAARGCPRPAARRNHLRTKAARDAERAARPPGSGRRGHTAAPPPDPVTRLRTPPRPAAPHAPHWRARTAGRGEPARTAHALWAQHRPRRAARARAPRAPKRGARPR